MDTITESNMAVSLAREGGIGIIHRFMTIEEQVDEVHRVKRSESVIIEQPYFIGPENSASDANKMMSTKGISGLLVIDNGKLVGIITRRDILFQPDMDAKISDLMTKDIITASEGVKISEAKDFTKTRLKNSQL